MSSALVESLNNVEGIVAILGGIFAEVYNSLSLSYIEAPSDPRSRGLIYYAVLESNGAGVEAT